MALPVLILAPAPLARGLAPGSEDTIHGRPVVVRRFNVDVPVPGTHASLDWPFPGSILTEVARRSLAAHLGMRASGRSHDPL